MNFSFITGYLVKTMCNKALQRLSWLCYKSMKIYSRQSLHRVAVLHPYSQLQLKRNCSTVRSLKDKVILDGETDRHNGINIDLSTLPKDVSVENFQQLLHGLYIFHFKYF